MYGVVGGGANMLVLNGDRVVWVLYICDKVHRPVSVLRQWWQGGSSNMKLLRYRDQGGK